MLRFDVRNLYGRTLSSARPSVLSNRGFKPLAYDWLEPPFATFSIKSLIAMFDYTENYGCLRRL
jgi:hypothetical protein